MRISSGTIYQARHLRSFAVATAALLLPLALAGFSSRGAAPPSAPTRQSLEAQYTKTVKPFVKTYCVGCHGAQKPAAQLNLASHTTLAAVIADLPHWTLAMQRMEANEMPPSASKQPSQAQRDQVEAWIRSVRMYEASRNAGDPGPVLVRRLSNAEYDYTIRDLTGADIRPTREFPVDPANQEGFDNSGESLTLSPSLLKKYIQAARTISEHMTLTSRGLEFASHPVLAETDRDKYGVLRIVDFYRKQPTDYADYFRAAWRYKNRDILGKPNMTLAQAAADTRVSARYLDMVWKTLNMPGYSVGPMARLQDMWNRLPAATPDWTAAPRAECNMMRDWVLATRKKLAWKFSNLQVPGGFSAGGQCFVLWKDRQYASHRRKLYPEALQVNGVPRRTVIPARKDKPEKIIIDPIDPELFVPEDAAARARYIASFEKFCNVFPDAFYIAERGRMFVDDPGDQGRLLTAGLHNSMGYFRDDTPLMELILDDKGRAECDRLWLDFDMVAFIPERMHLEFFVYERAESGTITDPEFNFARAEDKEALSDANIRKLRELYYAKAVRNGAKPPALKAIDEHFDWVATNIRSVERARVAAEPKHRASLLQFAERAYRRPLTAAERTDLSNFYTSRRQKQGLTHEDALRDTVVRILMSPNFLFRVDLETTRIAGSTVGNGFQSAKFDTPSAPTSRVEPLSDYALASRLSYFLWSSMPDSELMARAAAGDLHRPEVLVAQARRMLKSPKIRAFALEFGGNWLDFRRFEEHNAVDRERFPKFTNALREAMFEEPLHFLVDMCQNNRSVHEMLYGKYTFVNPVLARHYEMDDVDISGNEWVKVPDADKYGRGGLLPMGVFLTKNSPGLRTSPVKRGYWMVRRVLGENIPPPPAVVPELPKDESKLGDLTLRQALENHRNNPACSGCHARFDSYGLVFENYGPIGERRSKDLGGKPVDIRAPFPGAVEKSGVKGLQDYVRQKRDSEFLDNLCRKMLSYALGRTLLPSDDATLAAMRSRLTKTEYRFASLVDTIVTSRQFRNRRATTPASNPAARRS